MTQVTNKKVDIAQRLRDAAKSSLSKEELKAQKVSFAIGMQSEGDSMTKEEIKKLVDERY